MRHTLFTGAFVAGLTIFAAAAAGQSLASSTFVSSTGDNQNDCTRTAPCRTFQAALDKTAPSGTVTAITPGEYGILNITKPISIIGLGPTTRIDVPRQSAGITINVEASDQVTLSGLFLNGHGVGWDGIDMRTDKGGKLTVTNCVITNFTEMGIALLGGGNPRVLVRDSYIGLSSKGMAVNQFSGAGVGGVVLDNTTFDLNTNVGYEVQGYGKVATTISNTDILRSKDGLKATFTSNVTSYGNNRIRSGDKPGILLPTN